MAGLISYEQVPPEGREWAERFVRLAETFRSAYRIAPTTDLARGAPFEVDGVAMSLRHDPSRMPFHLQILADFGPAPHDDAQALRGILESSHADLGTGAGYAIAPGTGRVVACVAVPLVGLEVNGLGRVLSGLADAARRAQP